MRDAPQGASRMKLIFATVQVAVSFFPNQVRCGVKKSTQRSKGAEMRREKIISDFDTCTSVNVKTVNRIKLQNKKNNLNTTDKLRLYFKHVECCFLGQFQYHLCVLRDLCV